MKRSREEHQRALLADEHARQQAEAEAVAAAGPQPGPHLELSHTQLQLTTSAPSSSSSSPLLPATEPSTSTVLASFSLRHRGTAAVYFTWVPQPTPTPPFSTSAASAAEGGAVPPPSGFSLSRLSGAVLPGETAEFKVAFRPDRPGKHPAPPPWDASEGVRMALSSRCLQAG